MKRRNLMIFIIASAFMGISQSIDSSVFNNFLSDVFHLTVSQRTILEIPREFPGFMVVFVIGSLLFLGDARLVSIAGTLAAMGMFALGFTSGSFSQLLLWMAVYSMGTHIIMPISNSIGMELAEEGNMGKVLGRINGVNTAAFLITSLVTALIFHFVKVNYKIAFSLGALGYLISALLILGMKMPQHTKSRKKLFIKKEYTLFYFLSILYGARKQIFITFGPWVLIKIFNQGVSTFAVLGFFIAGIGMFFKPLVGYLIDKKGERFVIKAEALLLIVVCMGYALARTLSKEISITGMALFITGGCYILDQLLTAAGMARATYLKKIALSPEDVSPTLSMGISIDHMVSMVVPWLGGLIWNCFGYEYVFFGGACIALLNLLVAHRIHIPARPIVEK